jgi:hypothetical protein
MTHMGEVSRSFYPFTLALLLWGCDPLRVPRDATLRDVLGMDVPDPERDQDRDGISDLDEGIDIARDSDGDGAPDHRDVDSDDDTIGDVYELRVDTDVDGAVDALDLDSDADGLLDRDEAGDADVATSPIDSDGDAVFDFRDPDSDGDGLSDHEEAFVRHTSPVLGDSDGDGVSDLIEVAAGTDAVNPEDNPPARGDFVFVVPFEQPPSPTSDTLSFRTRIQLADLYFLFDRSGSMGGEIGALGAATSTLVSELTCASSTRACTRDSQCDGGQICGVRRTCIEDPSFASCIASPFTGAGWYLDGYVNVMGLQADPSRTASALSFGVEGADEWLYRALWGVVDPVRAPGNEGACITGGIGCPAFRSDAVRILVAFTDENSDGPESVDQAASALRDAGVTLIGIWAGSPSALERAALTEVVRRSGSLDRRGQPLMFDGLDAAAVPAVRAAIREIVEGVPLRVTIAATDEVGDDGDARAFLSHFVARSDTCGRAASEDTDRDGFADTFPSATPGTEVCWDVVAATNTTVAPIDRPQLFHARLAVSGDGSPLDARSVYFLVPPRAPEIEIPD